MNNLSVGIKILIGYVIVLVVMLLIGYLSLNQMSTIESDFKSVEKTQEILRTINSELSHIHDAETLQRGFLLTGIDSLADYRNEIKQIPQILKNLKELTSNNISQQKRIVILEDLIIKRIEELNQVIDIRKNKGMNEALKVVKGNMDKKVMDSIRNVLKEMDLEEMDMLKQGRANNIESSRTARNVIILVILISFIVVIFLTIYLNKIIAFPIREMAIEADRISSGDLSNEISLKRKDEIGELANAFRKMQTNLKAQLLEIAEGINTLSSSTSEINVSMVQLASTSAQTVTSVAETNTTIGEIRQTAELASMKSREVSEKAGKSIQTTKNGTLAVENLIEGMTKIQLQMDNISNYIVQLSDQSQTIGEITATVNELAEQSNLLAVNAAIEAARAGEHGKGFIVVAQEIKSMATRSKESTIMVRNILRNVQKSISSAVIAIEAGGKAVKEGIVLTSNSGESIRALSNDIHEAGNVSIQVVASSQQQLEGIDQVATAMESIKEAVFQASASTKQSSDAIHDLQNIGGRLKLLINQYKTEK